jgi:hypothetical protein
LSGIDEVFHVEHGLIFLTRGQGFEFQPETDSTRIWLLPHTSVYQGTFETLEPEYKMSRGDYYGMFGSSIPNHVHGYSTYTERTFEGRSHITKLVNNMLISPDETDSPFEQKVALPIETFRKIMTEFEQRHRRNLMIHYFYDDKEITKVTTDDLTLSLSHAKGNLWVITATCCEGFKSLRSVIGNVGYGVQKSHPASNNYASAYFTNQTLTLQDEDIIRTVDVNDDMILSKSNLEQLEENHSYWNDENYIRLQYDTVHRELTITINFTTIKLSDLSADTHTFLTSNNNVNAEN